MRKLIVTIHLYLGLAAAVLILLFGVTGSVMAFEQELQHLIHWRLSHVSPGTHPLPLPELGSAALGAYPGRHIQAYQAPASPELAYGVELDSGLVSVNQYTGQVLGIRTEEDWIDAMHQLHIRFHLTAHRQLGRSIMSWAGVVMLLLVLSGLYLWWPVKRVTITTGRSPRRTWFDVHNAVGIFSYAFLLLLSVTGVVLAFDGTTTPIFYRLTGSRPRPMPTDSVVPVPGAVPLTPDQAMEIARGALPGAAPFEVNVPKSDENYLVRLRYPEDLTPGGRSRVLVNQYTGKVVYAEGSRTAPGGARAVNLNRAIHTGDVLGVPSKVVMSLASLMTVIQVLSGFMLWRARSQSP
jgi:uncharacterized iron-regulated membrane protein